MKIKLPEEYNQKQREQAQVFESIYANGMWFVFPKSFALITRLDQAVLLSYLVNISQLCNAVEKTDGWFYHTTRQIEDSLYINRFRQNKIIKGLLSEGIVEARLIGCPAKRMLRVRYDVIGRLVHEKVVELIKEKGEDCPKVLIQHIQMCRIVTSGCDESAHLYKENEEERERRVTSSHCRPSRTGDDEIGVPSTKKTKDKRTSDKKTKEPPKKTKETFFEEKQEATSFSAELAELLYKSLKQAGKILRKPKGWSLAFQKLENELTDNLGEKREIARQRIKKVLDWYLEHLGEAYIPVAFSAGTFREKFLQIEEAMARAERPLKKPAEEFPNGWRCPGCGWYYEPHEVFCTNRDCSNYKKPRPKRK